MEEIEKSVYTINEVCILLSVTRKTLSNWENSGSLVPFKIGGSKRYNKEMIDKLIRDK